MKDIMISYCGLDCDKCREKWAEIRKNANSLDEKLKNINFEEIVKTIPFFKLKYNGYLKTIKFFTQECPGCRNNGGNPFCGIRKCAIKKGFTTCAECEKICKKFKPLLKIHNDNEIQNTLAKIRKFGINEMVNT